MPATSAWPRSRSSRRSRWKPRARRSMARAYEAAVAMLDVSKVSLREAALVAPISGIVAKRHVVPGEKVTVEQTLLTIVDLTASGWPAWWARTRCRAWAGHGGAGAGRGDAGPVVGRLARIAPMAEAGTRSIGVTIALDNRRNLRAGQYVGARGPGRRHQASDGAADRAGQHVGPGSGVGDQRWRAATPRGHARPPRRRARPRRGAERADRRCPGARRALRQPA